MCISERRKLENIAWEEKILILTGTLLLTETSVLIRANYSSNILPGSREIVKRCRRLGYMTGIVSGSSQEQIRMITDKAGSTSLFDIVVSADINLPSKPAGMYAVDVRIGSYGHQDLSHADYIAATLRHVEAPFLMRFPNVSREIPV